MEMHDIYLNECCRFMWIASGVNMATYYSTVTLLTLANAVANMKWKHIILLKHLLILAYANNFLALKFLHKHELTNIYQFT